MNTLRETRPLPGPPRKRRGSCGIRHYALPPFPHPIPWRRKARQFCLTAVLSAGFIIGGCARTPPGVNQTNGPQLTITMTVANNYSIDASDYYFVLFNVNPATGSSGPVPVITTPWGNGFAAGDITAYVRVDPTQANGGYGMYSVVPGSNDLNSTPLPPPTSYVPVTFGSTQTISFQIPISALATSTVPASQISQIQINFLATNLLPTAGYTGTKLYDALGDGRISSQIDSPITISATQSGLYDNSTAVPPEPTGDVMNTGPGVYQNVGDSNQQPLNGNPVGDIDIANWSVQVNS
ncbi:MAG: hypothetical protein ACLQVD_04360 [Capsulimonadaceae bacterium]